MRAAILKYYLLFLVSCNSAILYIVFLYNIAVLSLLAESYHSRISLFTFRDPQVHQTNVRVTPDGTEMYYYNVTGLRPYCWYNLRVRAENELGTSDASLPSESFVTGGTLPDKAPEDVGGGGGKVGDLVITWTVQLLFDTCSCSSNCHLICPCFL